MVMHGQLDYLCRSRSTVISFSAPYSLILVAPSARSGWFGLHSRSLRRASKEQAMSSGRAPFKETGCGADQARLCGRAPGETNTFLVDRGGR